MENIKKKYIYIYIIFRTVHNLQCLQFFLL